MLNRPRHRLPARFNRPVKRETRDFVARRSKRKKTWKREKFRRGMKRAQHRFGEVLDAARRWIIVVIIGMSILVLGFLLFSPYLTVREIRITRSDPRLDLERVQLSLAPLFGRHIVFLAARDASNLLEEVVPDMQEMELDKDYPGTLRVRIALEPIIARLEIDGLQTGSGGASVSVDGDTSFANGRGGAMQTATGSTTTFESVHHYLTGNGAYAALPLPYPGSLPLIHIVDWGARPVPGRELIPPEFMQRMRETEAALLDQFSQEARSRTVFLRAREFHLKLQSYTLWFDLQSPLADHLERYRTFLRSVPQGEAKQYVDLRISGRVIYR